MRRILHAVFAAGVAISAAAAQEPSDGGARYWPQFRGPLGTGFAPQGDPPVEWGEKKNIRWKVEIPGHGHASPIIWDDRVYVQTAVRTDRTAAPGTGGEHRAVEERRGRRMSRAAPVHVYAFIMMALDRRTGKTVWQRTLCEEVPHEGGHRDASQASNSPVTDGRHIIAYFGSRGLYCLDMQGKVIWKEGLGTMQTRRGFGEGSSPALYGDMVVVNWDHEGQSFIAAFDTETGEKRWKVDRDEPTSWATPVVVTVEGRPQVVASATNRIRGYELSTGKLVWECGGMTLNVVPTPVFRDGLLYCASGFRGEALLAIRYADATGDITDSGTVTWRYDGKGTPYVPSPLLYEDKLYFLSGNKAILSCVDAKSGQALYNRQRLEGLDVVFASVVGAAGRVYVADQDGNTAVIQHGPEFKLLGVNSLEDGFAASPAIVGKELYLRGQEHLYCIAAE
jgi:outer membrane protein assembly factor BamB